MAKITNTGVFIVEGSAAAADVAGSSQIWTKSDAPSSLYHTDDAGTDYRINGITVGTDTASTSGSSIDFTGIPAGVKRVTLSFENVNGSGTEDWLVRLGDSGGIETTGYTGHGERNGTTIRITNGFALMDGYSANEEYDGFCALWLKDAANNTWAQNGALGGVDADNVRRTSLGMKSLSGVLTQVRVMTAGSDTFGSGSISMTYE